MPETTNRDAVSAEDAKKLANNIEKDALIRDICILKSRKDAIEEAIKDRGERLENLMMQDGERERAVAEGDAEITERRSVQVLDVVEAAKRFTPQVLAEHWKPPIAFVEAAQKEGVNLEGVVRIGRTPVFEVSRARTKDQKAFQKRIIEETRAATEATVAKIREALRGSKKKGD